MQVHRLDEKISQPALRAEHFAKKRTDQRERKSDADPRDDFRQRRGEQYPLIFLILAIVTVINMSLYAWEQRLLARRRT